MSVNIRRALFVLVSIPAVAMASAVAIPTAANATTPTPVVTAGAAAPTATQRATVGCKAKALAYNSVTGKVWGNGTIECNGGGIIFATITTTIKKGLIFGRTVITDTNTVSPTMIPTRLLAAPQLSYSGSGGFRVIVTAWITLYTDKQCKMIYVSDTARTFA